MRRMMRQASDKYISYCCTKCGYRWALDRHWLHLNNKKPNVKVTYTKKGYKIVTKRRPGHCWCETRFPLTVAEIEG
tara:strand:- start:300 stop:527 length:228 start_codon:yes stop_codon:yes gene_type:complete